MNYKELISTQIPRSILDKCVKIIGKYAYNVANDAILFNNSIGSTYQGDIYNQLSLKRLCIKNSKFIECSYINCVSTGSIFQSVQFIDCDFVNSNFQYTNMPNSKIMTQISSGKGINGSNFSNVNFSSTILSNIEIHGSSFSHGLFYDSVIDSCIVTACSFEDACFKNALLKNINLSEANIEYADFSETLFERTQLSPMQLPYTYGGLDAFYNKKGIKLYAQQNNIQKEVSKKDFDVLLSNLCVYYAYVKEYFPLANILLFRKDKQEFHDIIMLAIKVACINKNLRDVKHIVKLVILSKWYNSIELKELYYTILKILFENNNNLDLNFEFSTHIGDIQALLLPNLYQQESVVARFVIDSTSENTFNTISVITKFIHNRIQRIDNNINWNKIELRKNSPIDIVINFVVDNKDQVLDCIQRICELILVALPSYLAYRNTKRKTSCSSQNSVINIKQETKINNTIIIYKNNIFQEISDVDVFIKKMEEH